MQLLDLKEEGRTGLEVDEHENSKRDTRSENWAKKKLIKRAEKREREREKKRASFQRFPESKIKNSLVYILGRIVL